MLKERFARARLRAKKVGSITKGCFKTKTLFQAGVKPQAVFGSNLLGLSRHLRRQLDGMAMHCCRQLGYAPKSTCSLMLHLGEIPSCETMLKFFVAWTSWWIDLEQDKRPNVITAWNFNLHRVQLAPDPEKMIKCPLTACQAHLHWLKWKTASVDTWIDTEGRLYNVKEEIQALLLQLKRDLYATAWKGAEQNSYKGEGLGSRPCLSEVIRARNALQRKGKQTQAFALMCVAAGGSSTGERFRLNRQCCRCGAALEMAAHRFYECPANKEISDPEASEWLTKTAWLQQAGRNAKFQPECLFLRGILPASMSLDLAEIPTSFNFASGNQQQEWGFTDGSGGSRCGPKWVQKVGAAAWGCQFENHKVQSITVRASGVKGKQSVPRAELTAAILGLEFCKAGIESDCKYVVNGSNLLMHRLEEDMEVTDCKLLQGTNVDLWMNLKEVIARRGYTHVEKVKAHADIEMVANGEITIQEFIGNHIADIIAKAAAKAAACPRPDVRCLATYYPESWRPICGKTRAGQRRSTQQSSSTEPR